MAEEQTSKKNPRKTSNKRVREEEDQILRISIIVVVILFVVAGIFVGVRLLNPREDVTAGREKLEELTSVDVAEVESVIVLRDKGTEDTAEEESEETGADEEAAQDGTAEAAEGGGSEE